jgi:hypothetical protein
MFAPFVAAKSIEGPLPSDRFGACVPTKEAR